MAKQGSSTKQLKQTLGFWDLMSTAIGQIIGAGIMTLLGSAIALTGRSVPISFLIAAVLVVGYSIPKILICGAVRARGGEYTMVAMLGGTRMAGIYTVVNTLSNLSLAMYSLSFASYFISLFGFGNEKVIALIVTTLFFLINIVGVDIMEKFQNLIVAMLCIALGLFAVVGLKHVQPDYLTNGFLTGGIGGLFQAGGLLTFAVGGSTVVANLSAEAKKSNQGHPGSYACFHFDRSRYLWPDRYRCSRRTSCGTGCWRKSVTGCTVCSFPSAVCILHDLRRNVCTDLYFKRTVCMGYQADLTGL